MAAGSMLGAAHGVYDGLTTESPDVIKDQQITLRRLVPHMTQKKLADDVIVRLADAAANVPIAITDYALEEVDDARDYHTLLEVTLLQSRFAISGVRSVPICLRMLAKAIKFDPATHKQLGVMTTEYQGDCLSYDDWIKDDARTISQGIDAGYEMLSRNIIDKFYAACSSWKFRNEESA